jgi:hypothetical protein
MQAHAASARDPASRDPVDVEPFEKKSPSLEGGDTSMDPETMTLEDWVEAEGSRPTLPDENADGLDDMEAEIQHQAEDRPTEPPGR